MGHLTDLKNHRIKKPSLLAIGVFDGVHLGHQHLFSNLIKTSKDNNLLSAVLTFKNHPGTILNPDFHAQLVTTTQDKIKLIESTGVDFVVPISFDKELSQLSAKSFIELLQKHLNMNGLSVGPDFHMGANREADVSKLSILGKDMGFFVNTPCLDLSKFVSNTRIPPTRTVISGAVSFNSWALSTSVSSAETVVFCDDPLVFLII